MKKLKCALCIDDDDFTNFLNQKILVKAGIEQVKIASNSVHAWLIIEELQSSNIYPELIFLDINMPVMNGFDFLGELYEKYPDYKAKVVILSSSKNENDYRVAELLGVACYLEKPLTIEKVEQVIKFYFR